MAVASQPVGRQTQWYLISMSAFNSQLESLGDFDWVQFARIAKSSSSFSILARKGKPITTLGVSVG